MTRHASIYDICDPLFRGRKAQTEPGSNLRLIYRKLFGHPLLKYGLLKRCRHPAVSAAEIPRFQLMMRRAVEATVEDWRDPLWVEETFRPLAELLDTLGSARWQVREEVSPAQREPSAEEVRSVLERCLEDVERVWRRDRRDPWLPVAAQIVLSGDDHMDGKSLLEVLQGVGSCEYRNITVLFALIRCWLMANPGKLRLIRRPYAGVAEPMSGRAGWIWHRIAFSDVNFFEHLLVLAGSELADRQHRERLLPVLENLLRYCLVVSRESLVSPNKAIRHPAVTCLPKDESGRPLCRLTPGAWRKKRDLGFGDYVPDTDTTFLSLAMARKWLDAVSEHRLRADPDLLQQCEEFLAHPWLAIIREYQVGGECSSNPPTIGLTRPLDYEGSVPIWFDKPFRKADGRVVREVLGNEICPGHNMDILDAILLNRRQWRALEGENLAFLRRLLGFHHRAFVSGNFARETALMYYLPEIYVYYLGRLYRTWRSLDRGEQRILDPDGQVEEMRRIALQYCREELAGRTLNPFDAALAVSAVVLLEGGLSDHRGTLAAGLRVLVESLGEGPGRHPYRAYEWNRMRHPTRILVGSEVSTSLFVLRACAESLGYLYADTGDSRDRRRAEAPG